MFYFFINLLNNMKFGIQVSFGEKKYLYQQKKTYIRIISLKSHDKRFDTQEHDY